MVGRAEEIIPIIPTRDANPGVKARIEGAVVRRVGCLVTQTSLSRSRCKMMMMMLLLMMMIPHQG